MWEWHCPVCDCHRGGRRGAGGNMPGKAAGAACRGALWAAAALALGLGTTAEAKGTCCTRESLPCACSRKHCAEESEPCIAAAPGRAIACNFYSIWICVGPREIQSCCLEHLVCLFLSFQAKISSCASRTSYLATNILDMTGQLLRFSFSEISPLCFMCASKLGMKATDSSDILWMKLHSS